MKRRAVVCTLLCLWSLAARATLNWQRIGPDGGGRVPVIAVAPSDPQTVYAGNQIIYRSGNGGVDWTRTGDIFPSYGNTVAAPLVKALAVSPTTSARVLAATAQGLFITTNGGASWARAGNIGASITAVAFAPDGRRTYASGGNALFRSTNGGDTWDSVPAVGMNALCADPLVTDTVFAALMSPGTGGLTIAKSTNAGSSFAPFSSITVPVVGLQGKTSNGIIYAAAPGTGGGVLRIARDGSITSALASPSLGIAVPSSTGPFLSASNPATDTVPVYRVYDDGSSDLLKTGFGSRGPLAVALGPGQVPIVTTARGGVLQADGTGVWSVSNSGLQDAGVTGVYQEPNPLQTVLAAAGDGLYRSKNGGDTWSLCQSSTNRSIFAASPAKAGRIYHTGANGLERSDDGGETWRLFTGGLPSSADIEQIVCDPVDAERAYVVTSTYAVYSNTFDNPQWKQVLAPLTAAPVSPPDLVAAPSASNTLYFVRTGLGMYRTVDDGAHWTQASSTVKDDGTFLAVSPTNANTVYRARSLSGAVTVWETTTGGDPWTLLYSETGATTSGFAATFLALDPRAAGRILLGTNRGLRISDTNGTTWRTESIGSAATFCSAWSPGLGGSDLLGTSAAGVLLGRPQTQGDVDTSGDVSTQDVLSILLVAGSNDPPTPDQLASMDLNGDGAITPADADLALRASQAE